MKSQVFPENNEKSLIETRTSEISNSQLEHNISIFPYLRPASSYILFSDWLIFRLNWLWLVHCVGSNFKETRRSGSLFFFLSRHWRSGEHNSTFTFGRAPEIFKACTVFDFEVIDFTICKCANVWICFQKINQGFPFNRFLTSSSSI